MAKLLDPAYPAKPPVRIELTYDEAKFLYRLTGNHITGNGDTRKLNDGIHSALHERFRFIVNEEDRCPPLTETKQFINLT